MCNNFDNIQYWESIFARVHEDFATYLGPSVFLHHPVEGI